jgi:hypothetical protein
VNEPKDGSKWAFTLSCGIVPIEMVHTVDDAYNRGQPYMDNLVELLRERGASTAEESAASMRKGLLRESWQNVLLTETERRGIWDRYRVPFWKRLHYRWLAWFGRRR